MQIMHVMLLGDLFQGKMVPCQNTADLYSGRATVFFTTLKFQDVAYSAVQVTDIFCNAPCHGRMAGTDISRVVVINEAEGSGDSAVNFYMVVLVRLVGVDLTFLLGASRLSQELHISLITQLLKQELKRAQLP